MLQIKFFISKLAEQPATLQFKEALREKERERLRGSGEIAKKERMKENGGQMNICGSYVRS